MAARYLFTIACFFALHVNALETVNGRIKITVQTTSGCDDTVSYIQKQLAPTYEAYKDFLDIEFVPWGRARREKNGTLTCQFGRNDCRGNRIQRCALNMLKGNPDAQMDYMLCEFTTPFPAYSEGSYECALAVDSMADLHSCVINPDDELDLADEVKGNEMTDKLDYIPSIVYNNVIDSELHNDSLQCIHRTKNIVCCALAATTGDKDCDAECDA